MPNFMLVIIILFVAVNAALLFLYYRPSDQSNIQIVNQTKKTNTTSTTNQSNITAMTNSCLNSTMEYASRIENITNITMKASAYFTKKSNATSYLSHNWSNSFYDINGTEKDIANKSTVSIFEIITNKQRNFTVPVVCDENGTIGNYSSCLLRNVPDIPSACYNLTINMTDCEDEWANHFLMDDIHYWITPPGGSVVIGAAGLNITKIRFNFTINSTRMRLESFGMSVIERTFSPTIRDEEIFSLTNLTSKGKGGTLYKDINVTDMRGVELYATVWFKKKCYDKYVIY
jgi:hypothetical protein